MRDGSGDQAAPIEQEPGVEAHNSQQTQTVPNDD